MKIVAFLTFAHILLLSSVVEGRRHNFRGIENERELKGSKTGGSKSGPGAGDGTNRVVGGGGGGTGGSKSGGAGGVGNRVAPECMMTTPPNCVTWPLDEEAINRATGDKIPGYTLSETVINQLDGALYRIYLPDSGTLLLPTDDFLSGPNRVPIGGNDGGEIDGGGLLDPTPTAPTVSTPSPGFNRIPGSFTTRTGSCSKSIPNIGEGLPENCEQGDDCNSGNCAVSSQVVHGVCVAEVPDGWTRLPAIVACVNK